MNAIAGLLMVQAATFSGTVPVPNAQLDAANDCLVAGTKQWVAEYDWKPEVEERWRWATRIVDGCRDDLNAAASSKEAVYAQPPTTAVIGSLGISKRQMLRSEALYYVDRLIREHFEGIAQ